MASEENPIPITVHTTGGFVPKCLDCIGEYISWRNSHPGGPVGEDDGPPEMNDAITFAPSWQLKVAMGQQMMACVPVPACLRHLGVHDNTLENVLLGSKLLQGRAS